jgi:hypothetical protein
LGGIASSCFAFGFDPKNIKKTKKFSHTKIFNGFLSFDEYRQVHLANAS